MNIWNFLISFISAEWLLNSRDNGGSIIALRAIIMSTIVFLLVITFLNALDPNKNWNPPLNEFGIQIKDKITWFGILFGSVYAALYTRFSSQWAYLANLYNMIKQSACNDQVSEDVLAEWKAGFIEDAEYLHLAHKENFVSIISAWGNEDKVKAKYIEFTPGGEIRHTKLMNEIAARYTTICRKNGEP